jgi:hypothetical protein
MTAESLLAGFIFGSIGLGAFIYGKRQAAWRPMVLGIALMVYPYFIADTALVFGIGAVLTVGLFLWRE